MPEPGPGITAGSKKEAGWKIPGSFPAVCRIHYKERPKREGAGSGKN
jgi:hypothetical protein